jgi:hypothetical protein
MCGGCLQDMKGGWAASPGNTAPVNPPALLALQPLLTQASTPVQTVQQSTTTAAQPKQDTSSKYPRKSDRIKMRYHPRMMHDRVTPLKRGLQVDMLQIAGRDRKFTQHRFTYDLK